MTKIWTDYVGGIKLEFEDFADSLTVPCVFGELHSDFYGFERIQLTPEDTVIDIGANVGMVSIYLKKKFGCKIIAFEPVPMNFERLKSNILLNGLSLEDFELHNTAITDVEGGEITIGTPFNNSGGSSVFRKEAISALCNTETINKYITDDCKYLKIDCEGGEFSFIPTILDKLNQFSYIGIELHKLNEFQDPVALHDLMQENFKGTMFYGYTP